MDNRVLTRYQVGLAVLCALGLGLAVWLTSTGPTVTYSTSGEKQNVEFTCTYPTDTSGRMPGTQGFSFSRGYNALMKEARRDEQLSVREMHSSINIDCARAQRVRLRTIVWLLAGVLALGVVLMGTFIIRLGRRRSSPRADNDRDPSTLT